jgi:hypothetical protein
MTELNMFCWSEHYNDDLSFQQKRYRIFNNEYTRDAYFTIAAKIRQILQNPNKLQLTDFWKTVTQDQIKQIAAIDGLEFDAYGFEYITNIKVQKELTDVEKAIELLTAHGLIKDGKILTTL